MHTSTSMRPELDRRARRARVEILCCRVASSDCARTTSRRSLVMCWRHVLVPVIVIILSMALIPTHILPSAMKRPYKLSKEQEGILEFA